MDLQRLKAQAIRIPDAGPAGEAGREDEGRNTAGRLRADQQHAEELQADPGPGLRTLEGDHAVDTVHDCRRTYCTVMADIVPPHRLQKLAGHASIETTLKFYIHTDDAYDDQVRSAGLGRPVQDTLRTHLPESTDVRVA